MRALAARAVEHRVIIIKTSCPLVEVYSECRETYIAYSSQPSAVLAHQPSHQVAMNCCCTQAYSVDGLEKALMYTCGRH